MKVFTVQNVDADFEIVYVCESREGVTSFVENQCEYLLKDRFIKGFEVEWEDGNPTIHVNDEDGPYCLEYLVTDHEVWK